MLVQDRPQLVRGRSVGLLCHPASVDRQLNHAADLLVEVAGAQLECLIGPEHGVRGEAQDMVGVEPEQDPRLGVPVHSLYGSTEQSLRPDPQLLADLDLVLLDLQDVGSRYYTYIWTMVMTLEACAEASVAAVVLDRPNPLGGAVEGPGILPGFTSFVGYHDVPTRHGLSAAEVALLAVRERGQASSLELEVIEVQGWERQPGWDTPGVPWVLPSPNMPTLDTALVYPGGCLLEGTNLSEGRGTTRPFEIFGAPWVDGWELARGVAREELPGVRLRPLSFCPTFHKHAGQTCGGVQVHVTDAQAFRPLRTYVALLSWIQRLWPQHLRWREQAYEFVEHVPAIDLLAGGPWLRQGVERGDDVDQLCSDWAAGAAAWRERCAGQLLYGGLGDDG